MVGIYRWWPLSSHDKKTELYKVTADELPLLIHAMYKPQSSLLPCSHRSQGKYHHLVKFFFISDELRTKLLIRYHNPDKPMEKCLYILILATGCIFWTTYRSYVQASYIHGIDSPHLLDGRKSSWITGYKLWADTLLWEDIYMLQKRDRLLPTLSHRCRRSPTPGLTTVTSEIILWL